MRVVVTLCLALAASHAHALIYFTAHYTRKTWQVGETFTVRIACNEAGDIARAECTVNGHPVARTGNYFTYTEAVQPGVPLPDGRTRRELEISVRDTEDTGWPNTSSETLCYVVGAAEAASFYVDCKNHYYVPDSLPGTPTTRATGASIKFSVANPRHGLVVPGAAGEVMLTHTFPSGTAAAVSRPAVPYPTETWAANKTAVQTWQDVKDFQLVATGDAAFACTHPEDNRYQYGPTAVYGVLPDGRRALIETLPVQFSGTFILTSEYHKYPLQAFERLELEVAGFYRLNYREERDTSAFEPQTYTLTVVKP